MAHPGAYFINHICIGDASVKPFTFQDFPVVKEIEMSAMVVLLVEVKKQPGII